MVPISEIWMFNEKDSSGKTVVPREVRDIDVWLFWMILPQRVSVFGSPFLSPCHFLRLPRQPSRNSNEIGLIYDAKLQSRRQDPRASPSLRTTVVWLPVTGLACNVSSFGFLFGK